MSTQEPPLPSVGTTPNGPDLHRGASLRTGGGGDDGFPGFPGLPARPARSRQPFWRRRPFLLAGAILLIIAVAVVTDIPLSSTPASKRSAAAATVKEISKDVSGCNAAVREAFTIYHALARGTLTKGQRGEAPSILSDDANGCSYTNQDIVDLASLGLPQVSIGKSLSHIAGRALAWADPDALTAIDDIDVLLGHPHQARATDSLRREVAQMARDRTAALKDVQNLATQLGGRMPPLHLRPVTL